MPDGTVAHINRGRDGRKQTCKFCGQRYSEGKLCDFPVGNGRTCDAAMCDGCARTLGSQHTDIGNGMKRLNDTIDVCPIHRGQAIVADGKIESGQPSLFGDAR
jgi:hypothetical protein